MNPMNVASNRTARLVREAATPVYSTTTPGPRVTRVSDEVMAEIQDRACTPDFCFICSRPTDHFGEHSDEQILAWNKR